MSDDELIECVSNGKLKAIKKTGKSIKSDVWKQFKVLYDPQTKKVLPNMSYCPLCKTIVHFSGSNTTVMRRHRSICTNEKQTSILSFAVKTHELDQKDKDILYDKCVEYVCEDAQSFRSIEGTGLFKLLNYVSKLSYDYSIKHKSRLPSAALKEALPDHKTVSSRMMKTGKTKEDALSSVLPSLI